MILVIISAHYLFLAMLFMQLRGFLRPGDGGRGWKSDAGDDAQNLILTGCKGGVMREC